MISKLQKVLQSNASDRAREAALAPVMDAFHERLIRFARQKIRQSSRPLGIDVEDLVQEAWMQLIARLQNPDAAPIKDEDHAFYLLRRVVLTRFLDTLDKQPDRPVYELDAPVSSADSVSESGQTGADRLYAPTSTRPDSGLFFSEEDGVREQFLPALFESDEAFRAVCSHPPRRRARQYQATVLYYVLKMIADTGGSNLSLRQEMALRVGTLIGIPQKVQDSLVTILRADSEISEENNSANSEEAIWLEHINELCGTTIENTEHFGKMRYELNQLTNYAALRTKK